jgi:hypothetical protein
MAGPLTVPEPDFAVVSLIVNLRRDCIEVYEQPTPERASYGVTRVVRRGEQIRVHERCMERIPTRRAMGKRRLFFLP